MAPTSPLNGRLAIWVDTLRVRDGDKKKHLEILADYRYSARMAELPRDCVTYVLSLC